MEFVTEVASSTRPSSPLPRRDDLDRIVFDETRLAAVLAAHEFLIHRRGDRLLAKAQLLDEPFQRGRLDLERLPIHSDPHS